jgi:hypothetical protein
MAPMLFDDPPQGRNAWHEASDEAWAQRAVAAYRAALARGESGGSVSPARAAQEDAGCGPR